MISKTILSQLEKLAKPGITISYTDLNNTSDKTTISDPKNELATAIKQNKVSEIVLAIYKNAKYKGKVGTDPKGNLHIVDDKGIIRPMTIKVTSESLSVIDPVNNKKTILQFSKKKAVSEVKISLQEQLLASLKKKTMSDKEVLALIKNMANLSK